MISRWKSALGGAYAGALLGALAGAVEALVFLERGNLSANPGSSVVFFLLSVSLYALVMSAAGADRAHADPDHPPASGTSTIPLDTVRVITSPAPAFSPGAGLIAMTVPSGRLGE